MRLPCISVILLELCCVLSKIVCSFGLRGRELYFPNYYLFADRRLIKHKIITVHAKDLDHCELLCYRHDNCVSLNIKKDPDSATGQQECELNNSTHMEDDEDLTTNNAYLYRGTKNACGKNRSCQNNAICQSGFTEKGYRCLCSPGFTGEYCEKVLSCKELYSKKMANEANSLCGLGACGVGRWKFVMKINGSKNTFHYHSNLWSNKMAFNVAGRHTVFDDQETKLETYWDTPFTKICLGMRIPGEQNINFVVINQAADSLYSLIADGQYRRTSLRRDKWKTLIGSQASLQLECNKEGFNAICTWSDHSRARIGFIGNNQIECSSCDSRIGFGTGGQPFDSNTCGNVAKSAPDNGNKDIQAMGYIFIL